jgi:hypothetical protein
VPISSSLDDQGKNQLAAQYLPELVVLRVGEQIRKVDYTFVQIELLNALG